MSDLTVEIDGKEYPVCKEVFDLLCSTSGERDELRDTPKKVDIQISTKDIVNSRVELKSRFEISNYAIDIVNSKWWDWLKVRNLKKHIKYIVNVYDLKNVRF